MPRDIAVEKRALLQNPHAVQRALVHACTGFEGSRGRFAELAARGATDAELRALLSRELGLGGGSGGPGRLYETHIGGANPQVWISDQPGHQQGPIHYRGAELLAAVRAAFEIGQPDAAPEKGQLMSAVETRMETLREQLARVTGTEKEITWLGDDGTWRVAEVRSWDTAGIATNMGRVRWDAKGLRLVDAPVEEPRPRATVMPRDIAPPPAIPPPAPAYPTELPLSRITRNPMNLRTTFDQASLEELAESLREVGMIDPLLVRPTPPARWGSMPGRQSGRDGWFIIDTTTRQGDGTFLAMEFYPNREIAESTLPRFELVDGERRYRASQLAELETVPVRVRELDDTAVLRIMFETAERRQSLNAVDRAEALVKLQELGVTQREIAEDLHVQQGTISRAMAVAQLPERVKEQGRQRQLSGSHLERLARFAHLPEVCVTLGELAAAQGASVRQLEQPVPFAQELQRANAILRLDYNTPFDHKTICPKCPFNAYRTVDQWTPVCLNPPHYRELAREAEAAKKAELEKARAAAAGGGKKLLQLRDLKYGTYEQISRQGCPPGCDEACACRAKAEAYGGDLVTICTDPKRYRKLQTAQAKAQKKGRQEVLARKIEHAGLLLSERQEIGSRELALPVYRSLGRVPVNGIRKALERAGVQLKADVFQFGYNQTGALDLLATLPPLVLARLAVEAEIAFDEVEVTAGHREQPQALDWYLGLGKSKKAAVPAEGENDAQ